LLPFPNSIVRFINAYTQYREERVRPMKKFITELRGKTVMTNDGKILGMIENFVVDTKTGQLHHVLVVPAEEVEPRLYKTDSQGRLVLPFTSMRSVRDVVVMDIG